jgi:SAM-dependent methyltransferase
MVQIARTLAERWGAENVTVQQASLPEMPFEDRSFDYVWCSLVLNIVDKHACMREFHRLLKPGGRVYVLTNSWARWLYKAAAAREKGDAIGLRHALAALQHGMEEGAKVNYLDLDDVDAFCRSCGFAPIGAAPAGMLNLTGVPALQTGFGSTVEVSAEGQDTVAFAGNIEFVAEKAA